MQFPDLRYSIDKKAFAVFRGWATKAKQRYPTLEIQIENEQEIVNDFRQAIIKGLESISEKEDSERDYYWCIGFLKGYLISSLSIAWSQKYLLKPQRYNNILWLKAITLYLDADELTLKRINRLYRYLLEIEFPSKEIESALDEYNLEGHYLLSDLQVVDNWKENKEYLGDIIYNETLKMLDESDQVEMPDLDEYFYLEEIGELIDKNPFIKK